MKPICPAHAEAKRGRSVSGPSCLDFPYVQLNIRAARASLFVQSTRGLDGFRVACAFVTGVRAQPPGRGLARTTTARGGAARLRPRERRRPRQSRSARCPRARFRGQKNRKERLSYRRFQCRAADSVLSVVENKREQACPQTESMGSKKLG